MSFESRETYLVFKQLVKWTELDRTKDPPQWDSTVGQINYICLWIVLTARQAKKKLVQSVTDQIAFNLFISVKVQIIVGSPLYNTICSVTNVIIAALFKGGGGMNG